MEKSTFADSRNGVMFFGGWSGTKFKAWYRVS